MLETRDLTIRFGGHVAVDAVSCAFQPGTLTAIVGPNGAGKTTYFNLISGQLPASAGQVLLNGQDITALPAPLRTRRGLGRAFGTVALAEGQTTVAVGRDGRVSGPGLSAALIRAWEARYGLIVPERTEAGYRLYSDDDVAVLRSALKNSSLFSAARSDSVPTAMI